MALIDAAVTQVVIVISDEVPRAEVVRRLSLRLDALLAVAPVMDDFRAMVEALKSRPSVPQEPSPFRWPAMAPPTRHNRLYGASRGRGAPTPIRQFEASQRDSRRLARQARIRGYTR